MFGQWPLFSHFHDFSTLNLAVEEHTQCGEEMGGPPFDQMYPYEMAKIKGLLGFCPIFGFVFLR